MYENLKNLNDLKRTNTRGIYKRWIYNFTDDFHLACDYLQKINYSIQDINSELNNDELGMKEVVYIIALVDWIKDSYIRLIGK